MQEAKNVLEKTRIMANNETQKMLLEHFDSKFTSILPMQIGWSIANGDSNFEFWFNDMVLVNTMYGELHPAIPISFDSVSHACQFTFSDLL